MGKTIKLTEIRKEDSELLFKWINDPELVVFNSSYKPVHYINHEEWMKSIANEKTRVLFAIRDENERLIGTCQLHSINNVNGTAELQIRIGTENQSRGIGTDAVRQLVSFGFTHLNLRKIYLYVFSDNKRAIQCYAKCNFTNEGNLKQHTYVNGEYKDLILMSVFK